jgi:hypothetical protein
MVQRQIAGTAKEIAAWRIGSRRPRRAFEAAALRVGVCAALAVAAGAGCHDPECEAARLELTRTWETLRDTATSRRQIPEGSNLSPAEEQERIRIWTTIEERAELMRSSFETPQVTWPSAEKARADLGEAFKPLATKDDPMTRGFALTLNEADQHMASFRKSCR